MARIIRSSRFSPLNTLTLTTLTASSSILLGTRHGTKIKGALTIFASSYIPLSWRWSCNMTRAELEKRSQELREQVERDMEILSKANPDEARVEGLIVLLVMAFAIVTYLVVNT